MDKVRVKLAHHYSRDGKHYRPGDELEVPAAEVRAFVRSGMGAPATKAEAKTAGVDPESAATARK